MATSKQNSEFLGLIISTDPLDEAIDYIRGHLDPEDVFDEDKLGDWAVENGYVKP